MYVDGIFKPQLHIIDALIKNDNIKCLIIEGEAGLGKTFITKLATSTKRAILINTYSTPLEFYHILYKFRNGYIIILDDIPKLWKDDISLGILLSALWIPYKVSYYTTSSKLKAPHSFNFNSNIIILTNKIPNGISAIVSRSYVLKQRFTYKEKLDLINKYCKLNKYPKTIYKFIKNNTDRRYKIDLRLPNKIYGIYKSRKNWKETAKTQLEKYKTTKISYDSEFI